MLLAFENYVKKNKLFSKEDKLLLALSGGEDSVCLFHLLVRNNYKFSVAHCNFQLRGADSNKDEQFVKALAKSYKIPFFSIRFDTKKEAKKLRSGIQETARKLRYDWFHELIETYRFDRLLTAHHQGDNSETMLINLLRSTGVSGLHGIPLRQNKIVRPLMFTNRDKISKFIKKNRFKFRLDKSNLSDHYLRNAIRQHVMPTIKKIEPAIDEVMLSVSRQVLEFEQLANELLDNEWNKLTEITPNGLRLPFESLHRIIHIESFLFYKLRDYGFNRDQVTSLVMLEQAQVGKKIESDDWELIKERDAYILIKKTSEIIRPAKILAGTKTLDIGGLHISLKKISPDQVDYKKQGVLFIDISSNPFPLDIRPWKKGDKMQPLGMKGSKKISDMLTDNKIDHSKRGQQLVILDKTGKILALLPKMISEAYKIGSKTNKVLSIHF
jgi:tRNA(Ile)-lysidine synthase